MTEQWGDVITSFLIPVGIGISIVCLMLLRGVEVNKKTKKFFRFLFGAVMVYLGTHWLRDTFINLSYDYLLIPLKIATFFEFLSSGIIVFFISMYIIDIGGGKYKRAASMIFFVYIGIHGVLLIISQFNNMYYYFNILDFNDIIEGLYQFEFVRGDFYFISNIAPTLMMIADAILLVRYRETISKRTSRALWFYIIAPIIAVALQAVAKVQFIMIATVIATANMFIVIVKQQTEDRERQKAESMRLDAELSMATRIQADMLPSIYPAFPERNEFDIYASMHPAKEVGGDFYDFFMIDNDRLGIVMADVSGKGVPAALFMMSSKIMIQNYAMINQSPKATLEEVNEQICKNNREEMFVTVWLGILDLKTGKLTAVNAGHEKPVYMPANGSFELVQDKHGFVLGGIETAKYKEYELYLKKGDKLFLYTDGVAEATDAANELFGTDRMLAALNTAKGDTPKKIIGAVSDAIVGFVKEAPQFDDVTMLCLEYFGADEATPDK